MTDLTFLRALREKLKGGNIRSIHLNALPGRYATRLDFTNLNFIEPKLAEKFFDQLISKACFEFPVSFDKVDFNSIPTDEHKRLGLLSKRLNSLFIENEDNYKEHGIKTFGFGFPILIKPSRRDPSKIIKAPIFIWQLELIKSTNKVNTWSILRNKIKNEAGQIKDEEIHSVGLNEVLLSFLKTDENVTIAQINEELLEDAIIDKSELVDECVKVLSSIKGKASSSSKENLFAKLQEPLTAIPDATNLESVSNNSPWIYFGGVFGLYKTQKESIITDIDRIIERFTEFEFEKLKVDSIPGTVHSAIETDPSQQEILSTLGIEPKKIIQGPPGTGKSQSLTALITNALANNLKCLVVCEKKTALDVIKKNLHDENDQLGSLAAVIEDISKDRDGIVNSVRDRLSVLYQLSEYPEVFYENIRQTVENKSQSINEQHQDLAKTVYNGKRWTEVVGEFLKVNRTIDSSELNRTLRYNQFKFHEDETELPEIINCIKIAKRLFKEIKHLNHPLEILNDEIFTNEISRAAELKLKGIEKDYSAKLEKVKGQLLNDLSNYENWLENFYESTAEKVESLNSELNDNLSVYNNWLNNFYLTTKETVENLIKDLETAVNDYKQWLDNHYDSYYWQLKQKIREYQLFANSNVEKFGEQLYYNNNQFAKIKIKILQLVSKRYKELKENRLRLMESICEIKEIHHSLSYFEHNYPEEKNYKSLSAFIENVNLLESQADDWYEKNIKLKEDYVNRMSSDFLHQRYENTSDITETENSFQKLIEHIAQDKKLPAVSFENAVNHLAKIELL
ncbi:MAG: hypothetical protein ACTHJN_12420, partial [Ginsengibacter sp.]